MCGHEQFFGEKGGSNNFLLEVGHNLLSRPKRVVIIAFLGPKGFQQFRIRPRIPVSAILCRHLEQEGRQ